MPDPVVSSRSDAVNQMPKSEIDLQLLAAVTTVSSREKQYGTSSCKLYEVVLLVATDGPDVRETKDGLFSRLSASYSLRSL